MMELGAMLGIALRPFAGLLLLAFMVRPLAKLIHRHLPDGRLKRVLFLRW